MTIFTCIFNYYYYTSYLKHEISIQILQTNNHSRRNSSAISTQNFSKELTDFDLVLPHCKIIKLNSSKNDIDYSEKDELNMQLDCVPGKTVPLTYIDSDRKQERSENEHVFSTFNILVNSTALRLHYGGDDNFKNCKYQRILRDIKSGNPDDSVTLTKSIKFKYDITVDVNSTHFKKPDDVNQNFDIFIRVRCFDNGKSVIYRNVHTVVRESVSHYIKSQPSHKNGKEVSMPKFNVLLMGIESTSNKNFERSLLKTYEYLKRGRKNVFTFNGYAKIGENTFPNLNALLTGKYIWEIPNHENTYFDNISLIWREYEKHGYSSIYLEDEPYMSTYNMYDGFYRSPSQFYFRPFTLQLEKTMRSLSSKDYCCVYGRNEVEMLLDYSNELIREMEQSNQPYFNFNFITRYTHSQLQGLDDVDELLFDYFKDLIESQGLNNTFIFLFGDHGLRFGSFRQTLNGLYAFHIKIILFLISLFNLISSTGMFEDRMPFLLAIPPDDFFTQYNQDETIFEANTRSLITPFDFHKTLLHLLEITNIERGSLVVTDNPGDYYTLYPSDIGNNRGLSLLQLIPKDRTCESANIPTRYCPCNWIKPDSSSQFFKKASLDEDQLALGLSKLIVYGVDLILKKIKEDILSNYSRICLMDELKLHTIMNAILVANDQTSIQDFQMLSMLHLNTNITKTGNVRINKILLTRIFGLLKGFILVFKVVVNEAVFETTLVFDKQNASRIFKDAEIYSLDYYETHSHCMKIHELKKFCHCRS
ncbi:unnamed protein product [Gordionus sp. m RMFG-2023]|uniref:uncharacterized protein LOC135930909 n=1 Tax=Gordionus sp. m RMFG-2023 TaxID=3053472 RepID=UPI0030DF53BA